MIVSDPLVTDAVIPLDGAVRLSWNPSSRETDSPRSMNAYWPKSVIIFTRGRGFDPTNLVPLGGLLVHQPASHLVRLDLDGIIPCEDLGHDRGGGVHRQSGDEGGNPASDVVSRRTNSGSSMALTSGAVRHFHSAHGATCHGRPGRKPRTP